MGTSKWDSAGAKWDSAGAIRAKLGLGGCVPCRAAAGASRTAAGRRASGKGLSGKSAKWEEWEQEHPEQLQADAPSGKGRASKRDRTIGPAEWANETGEAERLRVSGDDRAVSGDDRAVSGDEPARGSKAPSRKGSD